MLYNETPVGAKRLDIRLTQWGSSFTKRRKARVRLREYKNESNRTAVL